MKFTANVAITQPTVIAAGTNPATKGPYTYDIKINQDGKEVDASAVTIKTEGSYINVQVTDEALNGKMITIDMTPKKQAELIE